MGDYRRYHYQGHDSRDDRPRNSFYGRRDYYPNNNNARGAGGGHYSGSHFRGRGRGRDNFGDRFQGSQQRRDYSAEMHKPEDWRPRRVEDDAYKRRLQSDNEFSRKAGLSMETLKYMERLRGSKPYLQKRKREIIETKKEKLLEEELEDIEFCLDVISDVNADKNFGLQTIKTAYDKVLELVRNNPVTSVPEVVEVDLDDDIEEISAPRSPSPEANAPKGDNDIIVIPTERSQVKTDWNYRPDFSEYNSHSEGAPVFSRSSGGQAHSSNTSISRFNKDQQPERNDRRNNNSGNYGSLRASFTNDMAAEEGGDPAAKTNMSHQNPANSRQDWEGAGGWNSTSGANPWNPPESLPSRDQDMRVLESHPSSAILPQESSINMGSPAATATAFANNFANGLNPNAFVANLMNSSLMNQMMMGLQLTQQQQQMMVMNMVQNQTGMFPPASYPQGPNNQFNSIQTTIVQSSQVNLVANPPNQDNYPQAPRSARPGLLPTPRIPPLQNPFELNNPPRHTGQMFRPRAPIGLPFDQALAMNQADIEHARFLASKIGTAQAEASKRLPAQTQQSSFQPSPSSDTNASTNRRLGSGEINGDPRIRSRLEKERLASKANETKESQQQKQTTAKKGLSVETKATMLKLRALSEIAASEPVKIGDKEHIKAEMLKSTLQVKKALAIKTNSETSINDDYDAEHRRRRPASEEAKTSDTAQGSEEDHEKARRESDRPVVGSVKGYRIPKIKKPEPPPEVVEIPATSEDEEYPNAAEDVHATSSPASPVDQTACEVLESPESPDQVSSTVSKHGLDADDLLKDYLMQSLPADKLSKMNSDSMAKLLDSLKGELNAKLQQLSKDDNEELVEVDNFQPEEAAQVDGDVDVEESAPSPKETKPGRKSRASTRKGTEERRTRRSSLDKLHDALQSINFEAIMPLRPRRSTREPEPEPYAISRPTRRSRRKNSFIELGAEAVEAALRPVQVPTPQPDSAVEDDQSTPVKGKRGRKRKPQSEIANNTKASKSSTEQSDKVVQKLPRGRPRKGTKKPKAVARKSKKAPAEPRVTRSRNISSNETEDEKDDNKDTKDEDESQDNQEFVEGERRMDTADEVIRYLYQAGDEPPYEPDEDEALSSYIMDEAVYDVDLSTMEEDIGTTYKREMSRSEISLPGTTLTDEMKRLCDLVLNPKPMTEEEKNDLSEQSCKKTAKPEDSDSDSSGCYSPPRPDTPEFEDSSETDQDNEEPEILEPSPRRLSVEIQDEDNEIKLESASGNNLETEVENSIETDGPYQVENTAAKDEAENNEIEAKAENTSEDNSQPATAETCAKGEDIDTLKEETATQSDQKVVHNLEGHSLYQCANDTCNFTAADSVSFKEHSNTCGLVGDLKQLTCFHCDKKLKTIASLLEHLKTHGRRRQICTLCSFRCWLNIELAKHMKLTHKVSNYKIIKITENGEADYLMYPKDVWSKLTQPDALKENTIIYCPRVQFTPEEISSIPRNAIFPSFVYCGLCTYSTKVRSNIIRHLHLHEQAEQDGGATEVPTEAPVNPVPHLERNELMFDKMTNWAGSSHANKEKSEIAAENAAKVPQFVLEQFRYVCSVPSCKQLTGDDSLLRSHMRALHSDVDTYDCPHCQTNEYTRYDPRNSVTIDKIGTHLKLHGPKLLKCGHCDHIHIQTRIMERHVAEKHPERKPVHLVVRNLDADGNNSNRRPSVEDLQKTSTDRWRCTLCRALATTWEEAKDHCVSTHGIKGQFMCSSCRYCTSSIFCIEPHLVEGVCQSTEKEAFVMIMFSRNDTSGGADSKEEPSPNLAIWRRDSSKIKHIRGIYLEECKERKESKERKEKEPKEVKVKVKTKVKKEVKTEGQVKIAKASNIVEAAKSLKRLAKKRLQVPRSDQAVKPSSPPVLVCPTCKMYKTTKSNDFVIHLYNEFQYKRYGCSLCVIGFVTLDSLRIHVINDHNTVFDEETHLRLAPVDPELEKHIQGVLKAQVSIKTESEHSPVKHPGILEVAVNCKHCEAPVSSYHNYKTHLLAKHLAPDRFKCKHCDAGSWSEGALKVHHSKTHPDQEFGSILNDELEKTLTPEFWLKEYGIPHTKRTRGGLGRLSDGSPVKSGTAPGVVKSAKLTKPKKTAQSAKSSIKSPGRRGSHYTYKCGYCSKYSISLATMRSHWDKMHQSTSHDCIYFRYETVPTPSVSYCSYCSFVASDRAVLEDHFRHHHAGKKVLSISVKKSSKLGQKYHTMLVCSYCKQKVVGLIQLESHSQTNHPKLIPKYTSFTSLAQLDEKCFMDVVSFSCSHCKRMFSSEASCLSHMMTNHGEPMSTVTATMIREQKEYNQDTRKPKTSEDILLTCPKCEYMPKNLTDAKEHLQATHVYPFKCPVCDLLFRSPHEATFHFHHNHGSWTLKALSNKNAVVEFAAMFRTLSDPTGTQEPMEVDLTSLSNEDLEDEVHVIEESIPSKKNQTARKSTGVLPMSLTKTQEEEVPTSSTFITSPFEQPAPAPRLLKTNPSNMPVIDLLNLSNAPIEIDDYEPYDDLPVDALGSPSDPMEWGDLFVTPGAASQGIDFIQLG